MKIAVTGKGGVGKTTLSALLCHIYSKEGKKVIAVDADPDANLSTAIGISKDEISKIKPIGEMADLVEERTGAKPGSSGGIFKINPNEDGEMFNEELLPHIARPVRVNGRLQRYHDLWVMHIDPGTIETL